MKSVNFPAAREEQIKFVLSRLNQLQPQSEVDKYAIEQNTLFFESIRSVPRYINWLYGLRKHIRSEDLLEVNELLPELDEIFHEKMAEIERRPRPGIIRPVVEYITDLVKKTPISKRFRITSLGSGSMEAERQVIERLQQMGNTNRLTIVGFDIAPKARAYAEKNLHSLSGVRVIQEAGLTGKRLAELEYETKEQVLIVVSNNDIFTLSLDFAPHTFDLAMTALFLHHLHEATRTMLVKNMRDIAPQTLNYDGYQNEVVIPLLSLTGWHSPVFLNAAIFSTIRFPTRTEVSGLHEGAQITFYNHGHYRATFST
ncbi:hypothetical protein KGM48_00760 [Patescibacteria group bacterium]|nr:hypothetical protein [Patescibacteria group bacterium]